MDVIGNFYFALSSTFLNLLDEEAKDYLVWAAIAGIFIILIAADVLGAKSTVSTPLLISSDLDFF